MSSVSSAAIDADTLARIAIRTTAVMYLLSEGRILLRRCAFGDVAKGARTVVCGIHLGLLKATLERLNGPIEVTGLHPFVEDDALLCIVRMTDRQSSPNGRIRQPS